MTKEKTKFLEWAMTFSSGFLEYDSNKKEISNWFDQCNDNHKAMRSVLGGKRFIRTYNIRKGTCGPIDLSPVHNAQIGLEEVMPKFSKFLEEEGLDFSCLNNEKVSFRGKEINTNTMISRYADKNYKNQKYMVNCHTSRLGAMWKQKHVPSGEYKVCITCVPKGFALLGHYSPDKEGDSCFALGGCHWQDKFTVGAAENTFVALLKRGSSQLGRAWGWYKPETNAFVFTNFYNLYPNTEKEYDGLTDGAWSFLLLKAIREMTGDNTYRFGNRSAYMYSGVYTNGDAIVICPNKHKDRSASVFLKPEQHFQERIRCLICDDYLSSEEDSILYATEPAMVCEPCVKSCNFFPVMSHDKDTTLYCDAEHPEFNKSDGVSDCGNFIKVIDKETRKEGVTIPEELDKERHELVCKI